MRYAASAVFAVLSRCKARNFLELTQEVISVLVAALLCNGRNALHSCQQQENSTEYTRTDHILMEADSEQLLINLPEIAGAEGILSANTVSSTKLHAVDTVPHRKERLGMRLRAQKRQC